MPTGSKIYYFSNGVLLNRTNGCQQFTKFDHFKRIVKHVKIVSGTVNFWV